MTPGGDFGWTKVSRTFSVRGTADDDVRSGARPQHRRLRLQTTLPDTGTTPPHPGGTYPATALACSSCHDPHGKYRRFADGTTRQTGLPIFASGSYGNSVDPIDGESAVGAYRILGGLGYQPNVADG